MPGKVLLLIAAAVFGTAGTAFWLASDNTSRFSWLKVPLSPENPSPAVPRSDTSSPQRLSTTTPPPSPGDNALGFMLASVADQYSQNVQYPDWSTPLSTAQAEGYRGNRYEPVSLPLGNDGRFTVTLEQYRYTRGEPILVVAAISGPQVVADSLRATLEHAQTRDAAASATLTPPEGSGVSGAVANGHFEGILSSEEPPGEYRLIVEARIDGKPVRHVSTLTIEPFLGSFEGIENSYTADNNLVIPVGFDPDQPGFYALSGQLYAGERPIALLQAEKRLDMGTDTIALRAHGTVLADLQVDGPMALRHVQIRQLPARPGDRTHYAFGPEEGFTFSPPDLSDLRNSPVDNPESERRAALLRQLADKF